MRSKWTTQIAIYLDCIDDEDDSADIRIKEMAYE